MNQILMTEEPNNRNNKYENKKERKEKKVRVSNEEVGIESIIRFFCIAIIIFGLCLSGSGVYAIAQDVKQRNMAVEPVVKDERHGNSINLTVTSDAGIRAIKYAWNDSTEEVVDGKNKTEVETTINIIPGTNKLNITVIDSNNNTRQYVKNYIQEEKDTIEPVISITNNDPGIKITVTDDTALDYIVYKYGDAQEVRVDASKSDPTKIEAYIDEVQEAEVLLVVEAVDKAQNVATEEQRTRGATKPKISFAASTDPVGVSVVVNDNDGLRMVVVYVNDEEVYKTEIGYDSKEKEFSAIAPLEIFPVGESNMRVVAYNLSEQITEETTPVIRNE